MIAQARHWHGIVGTLLLVGSITGTGYAQATNSFTLFESGQVRPLALSPDGKHLYAVNTPDARLEIFGAARQGIEQRGSVAVGIEPVAVTTRSNDEVWVVNHLSDSVSVVNVHEPEHAQVTRTLQVGDEPRDIVFGGPKHDRAFITTAHRGQHNPNDPQLTTPSVGRADVWIFDAKNLGDTLGGTPLNILTLFTDTPRALAVTPDGTRVYAAGFHTGNRSTTIFQELIPVGGAANGGLPSTRVDAAGEAQPETGLIVKFNCQHWVYELDRVWDSKVRFNLPDKDVFVIDAAANPPAPVSGAGGAFAGVGTVLFNNDDI
jgi:YVTN family beta-propeller protein